MPAAAPARAPRTAPRRPSRAPAKPRRRTQPRRAPKSRRAAARAITPPAGLIPAAAARVGTLADSGLMQRMTRSRAWIGVLGVLLAGIVTVNVLSLSYTAAGGRTAARSAALQLNNAELHSTLTKKQAGPRIESLALANGLVVPAPKDITYLTAGDDFAKVAAHRIEQGMLSYGAAAPEASTTTAPVETTTPVDPTATTAETTATTETTVPATETTTTPVAPESTAP